MGAVGVHKHALQSRCNKPRAAARRPGRPGDHGAGCTPHPAVPQPVLAKGRRERLVDPDGGGAPVVESPESCDKNARHRHVFRWSSSSSCRLTSATGPCGSLYGEVASGHGSDQKQVLHEYRPGPQDLDFWPSSIAPSNRAPKPSTYLVELPELLGTCVRVYIYINTQYIQTKLLYNADIVANSNGNRKNGT